jgi:FkbM family methyltransferase
VTSRLVLRGRAALRERIRTRFGSRVVVREVSGARLAMPWSHRLPDYVRAFPTYGRNLVDLAAAIATDEPLLMLDLGANIGDSALQVLARVDARVLCIDGDPHWLPFLQRNTAHDSRITVEAALIVPDSSIGPVAAVRDGAGTTRFAAGEGEAVTLQLTADELRARHPDFARLRLIKSDTDGYDTRLVPLLARAWADAAPVLFFEFDPGLAAQAGDTHAQRVWDELAALGYTHGAAWANTGTPLGHGSLDDLRAAAAVLTTGSGEHPYWDVALATASDAAGQAALAALAPATLAGAGT